MALPRWWYGYEGSPILFVANPPVLTYHSGKNFFDDGYRLWIEATEKSEFVALSLVSFIAAAEAGVINRPSYDPRLTDNGGVLLPLRKDTITATDQMGFLNVISGTHFTRSSAYLAYRSSGVVDWDVVGRETPYLNYVLGKGETFEVPAEKFDGRY